MLVVDFSSVDRNESDSLCFSVLSADDIVGSGILDNGCYEAPVSLEVPKGTSLLSVFSFSPAEEGFFWSDFSKGAGSPMVIPSGMDCPPVYTYFAVMDTMKEIHTERVVPLKNYCRLSIEFRTEEVSSYRLALCGNVCGYATDGTLLEGEFSYFPEVDGDGMCSARIPRQKDASLFLDVYGTDGILRRFPLGDYMSRGGYDWTEPSLKDAGVVIDYALTEIVLSVDDWETVFSAEVMI